MMKEAGGNLVKHYKDLAFMGFAEVIMNLRTILRNLEAKGFVRREEEGRAHRYFPKVKHRAAQRRALRRLIDTLFLGSPEALLAQLVDDHDLTAAELRRIAKRLSDPPNDGGAP